MFHNWLSFFKKDTKTFRERTLLSLSEMGYLQKKWAYKHPLSPLSQEEKKVVLEIDNVTNSLNQNNLTRTKSYLDLYLRHPELHWSFLAHMVSRNAGWNMTDLKGSLVNGLLSAKQVSLFFGFLEKANHLIFQDAFPQLLLYEKSKIEKKDYSYLLPHFHISCFMIPIWQLFLKNSQSMKEVLTVSLIINEQHLLEEQVMKNEFYKKNIIGSFTFQLQELLGLTHILFPHKTPHDIQLSGLTVQQFSHVNSRVEIGKQLYLQLFHHIKEGAVSFAESTEHTGSRADYYPDFFSAVKSSSKIYSPALPAVWPDLHHSNTPNKDWFEGSSKVIQFYSLSKRPELNMMTVKHLANLVKLSGLHDLQQLIPSEKQAY
ncbi:DUF2515 family protein [Jeotgalibacillus proteolyticus]|uniref:DUF2515 domain-containing protein n=1 Tax=Jeotgalibacillus proteolyticus TaxID=2082395 RepID=A0A2S5GDM9_9BACL|nr:DUF2515 family protein [Jeotgalibacillus proteolyticus]PPA71021.1 DUF2515 domain-containing protein [Jeotgalibacillus proteolyticus]